MDAMLSLSLQTMLYGLAGVFAALAILYIVVKIIGWAFPFKPEAEEDDGD